MIFSHRACNNTAIVLINKCLQVLQPFVLDRSRMSVGFYSNRTQWDTAECEWLYKWLRSRWDCRWLRVSQPLFLHLRRSMTRRYCCVDFRFSSMMISSCLFRDCLFYACLKSKLLQFVQNFVRNCFTPTIWLIDNLKFKKKTWEILFRTPEILKISKYQTRADV